MAPACLACPAWPILACPPDQVALALALSSHLVGGWHGCLPPSCRLTLTPTLRSCPNPTLLLARLACPTAQVGKVLSFSPQLTQGRRLLRGWVITALFAGADLFTIV